MKSICVFCGSSDSVHADYLNAAHQLGNLLAQKGIHLIYGGGKTGLMGAGAADLLTAFGLSEVNLSSNLPIAAA